MPDQESPNADVEARSAHDDQHRSGRRSRAAQVRRQARVLALETLYETDLAHHHPREVLRRKSDVAEPEPEVAAYARELLAGVLQHRQELDAIIQSRATAWPLSQMAAIDRNILRVGLYECLHKRDTVPVKVAIDEAVELAKLFGSDSSARFVNGVIGSAVGAEPDDTAESTATQD